MNGEATVAIRAVLRELPETQALPWARQDDIADAIMARLDRDVECIHTSGCLCGDEWL